MSKQPRLNSLRSALMSVRSLHGPHADRLLHFHNLPDGSFIPCFDGQCAMRRLRGEQAS